ncbi:adenylate/guanylate cyclase domain-containing protein [Myxococcaceae bacterium GXIMD 01537]
MEVPTGTVALVFTDIQDSTRLWERCSEGMRRALEVHDQLLRRLLDERRGYEVKTQGDSFMVAFPSVDLAVGWCLAVQEALMAAPWPDAILAQPEAAEEGGPRGLVHRGLRVRMGVHVGEPECRVDPRTGRADYFGRVVNVAARVADAGHGGQVLVTGEAWARLAGQLEALGRPAMRALGEYRLKGIDAPLALVQLLPASLAERRFRGLRVPEERRGNLPLDPGELIGRAGDLATLRRWFESGSRLVTILGPGGMGKTRLATHFGSLEMDARIWEGGVWLCELTEADGLDDFCHAVGQALGVSLSHGGEVSDPTEQLGRALAGRGSVLLILDNLEHLVQHVTATLGRWQVLAPQACLLVTSREALRMPGERALDLAPLSLPAEGETSLDAVSRSEAVALFVQRVRAVQGGFVLTEEQAPLVAEIVRRLDGVALAIELAAARTSLMGVAQIRERLSRRFELLRGGRRDASERQATLWGAIDWSWNLLDATEQDVLAQCSAFRGGFTLEAAEAVVALPPFGAGVLEVVQSLRSKSLLRAYAPDDLPGELRLGMYESIREYASARLVEMGRASMVMARHAAWYLTQSMGLRDRVRGGGGGEALRRLSLERENLLSACDNSLATVPSTEESLSRALGVLVALEPEVAARGPVGTTLPRLDRALERSAAFQVDALLRAEALAVRGRTLLETGQPATARRDLERARALFLENGDIAGVKRAMVDLSIVARHEGEVAAAWSLVREAQELPSGGDWWLDAYATGNFGIAELLRNGPVAALRHMRAALEGFRDVGDALFEVGFLTNCGVTANEAGQTLEAVAMLEEAMARATSAGDRVGYAAARLNLGCVLLEVRAEEACEHLEAVVHTCRQLGMRIYEGDARGELGRALLALGDMERAQAHLAGAVAILARVSRWHALRFTAHLAAAQAVAGHLAQARGTFADLDAAPELAGDPTLRELVSLGRASLELAEARAAVPGSEEAARARGAVRERLERARQAPAAAASSDLRGWIRLLEGWLPPG